MVSWLTKLFSKPSPLELSPSDWVKSEGIKAVDNNVVVDISKLLVKMSKPPKVWIPPIPCTGSMLPNFSHEHNNILIAGSTKSDHAKIIDHLQVGDIAVYRIMANPSDDPADFSKPHVLYAIHRIIRVDTDSVGKFYRFKGDNNSMRDPYKVYPHNILWVSIGTIF